MDATPQNMDHTTPQSSIYLTATYQLMNMATLRFTKMRLASLSDTSLILVNHKVAIFTSW